jgi:tyrosinase
MRRKIMGLRVAILIAATASCLTAIAIPPALAQEVRYRKHVDDMQPDEWRALAAAITAMRQRDDNSTRPTPLNQPIDSYEWFVKMHGDATPPFGCEHDSELIWMWHRAFLLNFETVLNASRPAGSKPIRLPYWDWTDVPTGKNGFPAAYEDPMSPLFHDRNPHPASPGHPMIPPLDLVRASAHETGKQLITRLVQLNDWGQFGGTAKSAADGGNPGALEQNVHNAIHSPYVGKDNRNPVLSVRDPIFWAHHAMLDKVVTDWQAQHLDAVQCFDCDSVAYHDPKVGDIKVSALLHDDRLPAENGQTIKVVYLPKGTPEPGPLVAAAAAPGAGHMMSAAVSTSTPAPEVTRLRFNLTDVPGSRYVVRLNGLSVPMEESYLVTVYIYPASVKFDRGRAFAAKYSAGSFSQFAGGKHHSGATTARIDVTSAIQALTHPGAKGEWEIAIVFAPTEPDQSYAQIAPTIHFESIDLQRRDFATTETIPLTQKAAP